MKQKFTKGEKAYLQMPVEVKSIDKELGTLEAIFSTQDVDRHGDIVLQDGWDISMFKKNPVILNSHNYGDAAEVIGKASGVKVEAKKLQGKITFAVNENPKAKVIFDLYAGGFLNAFSVGFIPTAFKTNKDGSTDWYTIESAELLEVSAVSVPANARALAKAKGIDIDMLKSNDDEEHKPTNEDGEPEPEGDADALPKGDEVPPAPGEPAPKDGDGGESESDEGDEEAGADAGAPAGDEVIPEKDKEGDEPEAEAEVTPDVPVQASYASKVVKAIANIDSRQREELKRAAKIIKSILDGDVEGTRVEAKVHEQIQKRKINQAIRSLMKVR